MVGDSYQSLSIESTISKHAFLCIMPVPVLLLNYSSSRRPSTDRTIIEPSVISPPQLGQRRDDLLPLLLHPSPLADLT